MVSWIGEARAPDGSWRVIERGTEVRSVIRAVRKWREREGHLVPETRVRVEPAP